MKDLLIFTLLCFSGISISFSTVAQNVTISDFTMVSANEVDQYGKFEANFNVLINGRSTTKLFNDSPDLYNLYDPDKIKVDVSFFQEASSQKLWPAFFYRGIGYCPDITTCPNEDYWEREVKNDSWKIRFTPDKDGLWYGNIKVTYDGQTTSLDTFSFECNSSNNKGFAKISSNNLIEYSNGDLTMAVGENLAFLPGHKNNPPGANPNFACKEYCYNRYAKPEMLRWFSELKEFGGNYARVWFAPFSWELEPWGGYAGNYDENQNRAFEFDEILEDATDKELLIHLVLADRDGLRNRSCFVPESVIGNFIWNRNPYRNKLELDINNPIEFFSDERANKLFLNKVRYIIARWGYAPNLFSFELMNEFDQILYPCNDLKLSNKKEKAQARKHITNWHQIVGSYIKNFDPRFLNTSSTAILRKADEVNDLEVIDFTTYHSYTMDMHGNYQRSYATQRQVDRFNKPTLGGEVGFLPCSGGGPNIVQNTVHNAIWSNLFSGSFGTPLYWHWTSNHFPKWRIKAYKEFLPVRTFIDQLAFDVNDPFTAVGNARDAYLEENNGACPPDIAPDNDRLGYAGYNWEIGPIVRNLPNMEYLLGGISTSNNNEIEVFAMKNSKLIVGWIHNKHYYWYNIDKKVPMINKSISQRTLNRDNPCPYGGFNCATLKSPSTKAVPVLNEQTLTVRGVSNGLYKVEWYSTHDSSGSPLDFGPGSWASASVTVEASEGTLTINIPKLTGTVNTNATAVFNPDYAFRVTLDTGSEDTDTTE